VAIACDKTILKCHELKWAYCNGILRRWHEAGLHTEAEIRAGDRPAARPGPAAAAGSEDVAWMKKYIDQRDKGV
jgi:DNA replication protein DnaD